VPAGALVFVNATLLAVLAPFVALVLICVRSGIWYPVFMEKRTTGLRRL
jgi:hypothetical protein